MNAAIDSIIKEKSITVILAAHRLSTIARADRVVVIEEGVVSEEGRYDVLVSSASKITLTTLTVRVGKREVGSEHLWRRNCSSRKDPSCSPSRKREARGTRLREVVENVST